MINKLISIILTLYNKEDYIEELLCSIFKQSYTNWELIIINDCSTDNSKEVLLEYIKNKNLNNRIVILENKINLGVGKTFEKGLKTANGEYFAVCDADDVWCRNKLQDEINFLITNKLDLCYSDMYETDENLNIINFSYLKKINNLILNNINNVTFKKLIRTNHISGPSILFNLHIKKYLNNFPNFVYQDYWIVLIASLFGKIGLLNKQTLYYRHFSNGLSMKDNDKKAFINYQILKRSEKIKICNTLILDYNLSLENKLMITKIILANAIIIEYYENKIRVIRVLYKLFIGGFYKEFIWLIINSGKKITN